MKHIFLLIALIFMGCASPPSNVVIEADKDIPTMIGPDFRVRGNRSYSASDGQIESSSGCKVTYTYFKPAKRENGVLIVIGHGFMRSKKRMIRLAEHLASWGMPVATVTFCNSKLWAGNHDLNGADMVAVSQKVNHTQNIYIGFSAGGLAAMLAANLDENTLAFFGLDMVDHIGEGQNIASRMTIPLYGLIATKSICNAYNNGLEVYEKSPHSTVMRVVDASHCHFEFPVDNKCSFFCGKGEKQFSRETIQKTILGLTTAYLLWQSGIDPRGETYWSDNDKNFQSLIDAGYIENLNIDHER